MRKALNLKTAHIFRTLVAICHACLLLPASQGRLLPNRFPSDQQHTSKTIHFVILYMTGTAIPIPIPTATVLISGYWFYQTKYRIRSLTKQYYIIEKIGNKYYRTPMSFSMEEFLRMQGKKDEDEYFKRRAAMLADMNRRLIKPKFNSSK